MDSAIRVLLVDDEERFVANLARLLTFRNFDTATALDGLSAIAHLERGGEFDVVVLDIKMPGMDGLTTLSEIKRRSPETEVIMLTGHATVESGIQALREGAYDYLMKPCDIDELAEKITEACEVERIRRRPLLWPRRRVRDITRPLSDSLYAHQDTGKALAVFRRRRGMPSRTELYIEDETGRFEGILSRNHLLAAARKAHARATLSWDDLCADPGLLPPARLGDLLEREPPLTADPEAGLADTARWMIAGNRRCLPVVEGGHLMGGVRLLDIFRHVGCIDED